MTHAEQLELWAIGYAGRKAIACYDSEDDAVLLGGWLAQAIKEWDSASAERAIDALIKRAQQVAEPIDKTSKIRPSTFTDGHHHGLIEAIATLREFFPKDET